MRSQYKKFHYAYILGGPKNEATLQFCEYLENYNHDCCTQQRQSILNTSINTMLDNYILYSVAIWRKLNNNNRFSSITVSDAYIAQVKIQNG